MASQNEFKDFILEELGDLKNISCRKMMGEFLLYCDGVLFGGIYDDRLLIKKTDSNKHYLLKEEIPYPGAKPMFLVENIDDREYLCELITNTLKGLK